MNSNKSNEPRIVLPEESYELMGFLFKVHNELGPICKEKNYQDAVELLLKSNNIKYEREKEVEIPFNGDKLKGFFVDFIVNGKIILELKAKSFIKHEDIRQVMRYLKATGYPLAIIANFKRRKLEYKRVINPNSETIRDIRESFGQGLVDIRSIRNKFEQGSVLGIDYGEKKIGLAKSSRSLAVPLMILEDKGEGFVLEKIKEICRSEKVTKIVVGLPRSHGGQISAQQKKVEKFIRKLQNKLKIEIIAQDERLSTQEALRLGKGLKGGESDDAVAAMLILQSYLDMNIER